MIDREKVIKGIESCEPSVFKRVCTNCPYNGDANCGHVLWNDVLALLKEQSQKIEELEQEKCRLTYIGAMMAEELQAVKGTERS